jgi:cell wall-associated NlpC family hydrolase
MNRAVLLWVVAISILPLRGDTRKPRRYAISARAVALQPFSLDEPAPVRVAYNIPRAVPVPDPPVERDVEDENFATGIDPTSRGYGVAGNRDSHPIVPGKRAVLRHGIAYAPAEAPGSVKEAIWAANRIQDRPYVWGGGHGSFEDYGYDCSGTVSYALHHAGVLGTPMGSSEFLRYGERGRGRWVTIYARPGHTFALIAGLRLDTTDLYYGGDVGPRWHVDTRDTHGFAARHPTGL